MMEKFRIKFIENAKRQFVSRDLVFYLPVITAN